MSLTRQVAKSWKRIPPVRDVFDATISAISPAWGLKRRQLRAAEELVQRQTRQLEQFFDGASKDRLHGHLWNKSQLSPDSALESDMEAVRVAANELYRTFPYLHGAIEHKVTNVVGKGLRPQSRIYEKSGVVTKDEAASWKDEIEELFDEWALTAGPRNRQTFWKMQRNLVRSWYRVGEGLWILADVNNPDKPLPLQVYPVAVERLETPPEYASDPNVRLGIRYKNETPVAYYIREAHPHDTVDIRTTYKAYPANRVVHVYNELFEGQSRGLPWCFATMNDVRDFKDFREATIIAAQVAACVTLIVSTKGNPANVANAKNETVPLEPGQILYRSDVNDVHQLNPSHPATTYGMFSEWALLGIGAGLNYPFGWLVRDRRRASYSAGRLEEIEGSAVLEVDQEDLRDIALSPVWNRVISEGVALGRLKIDPAKFREHMTHFLRHDFPPPGRRWIDPPKEVGAAVEAIKNNLMSKEHVVAKVWGGDYDEVVMQRQREVQLEQELGITPVEKTQGPATQKQEEEDNEQES